MPTASRPVFISYARLDSAHVGRAVEFLRAGGLNVFVDSQSIPYGADWRQALVQAIDAAERVMLFWTAAAAASGWVAREWKLALQRGKTVVPTLLDDTPLPPPLARLHAVTTLRNLFPVPVRRPEDLADAPPPPDDGDDEGWDLAAASPAAVGGMAAAAEALRPSAPPPRAARPWRYTVVVGSLVAAGLIGAFLTHRVPTSGSVDLPSTAPIGTPGTPAASAPAAPSGPVPPGPASAASSVGPTEFTGAVPEFEDGLSVVPWLWVPGVVVGVAAAGGLWRRRRMMVRARGVVREVYAA
jgi:hypothetical protein